MIIRKQLNSHIYLNQLTLKYMKYYLFVSFSPILTTFISID